MRHVDVPSAYTDTFMSMSRVLWLSLLTTNRYTVIGKRHADGCMS